MDAQNQKLESGSCGFGVRKEPEATVLREILEAEDMKENRRERGQMGTMEGVGLFFGGGRSLNIFMNLNH